MGGNGRRKEEALERWRGRYQRNKTAYEDERARMDRREALYQGTRSIRAPSGNRAGKQAAHVRNIVAELIESQVSSVIPQPKVTALRPEDEGLAKCIEDMLRNQLDRLATEYTNDQEERTVPIQGGALELVEWDNTQRTHSTLGELKVTGLHPKKLIPQDGVHTDIEDMDYFFLELPQTKEYIRRRYSVDVSDESESAPEVKDPEGGEHSEDMVTQVVAYYRNRRGGIGRFSWVGEHVLEDMEDYQARRVRRCARCGARPAGEKCPYCGSTAWEERAEDYEELTEDIVTAGGRTIPAWSEALEPGAPTLWDTAGQVYPPALELRPTRIPSYRPDVYPVVLRKNVSAYGKFLGDSDVDKIEDQQETTKKLSTKVVEKLFKGGSILTAPADAALDFSDEELRILRLRRPEDRNLLGVYNLQPDVSGDLAYLSQTYEEARQTIGITNSFQGREDSTATSGVAKEFAARQSAGRFESKKTMKNAMYARLFEIMFKFMLAYSDEPRTIVSTDNQGRQKYSTFDRYDFLEQDAAGEWYWNTDFLFSTDASATLENDREAMWQEARLNFQQGAYGPVNELETLVLFWSRMARLHYPGAEDTKTYLEEKLSAQREAAAQAQAAQPCRPEEGRAACRAWPPAERGHWCSDLEGCEGGGAPAVLCHHRREPDRG